MRCGWSASTAHLQSHPEDLAAYDDAGVACDRLGRGDEAISWMEKKRAQLDGLDASRPEVQGAALPLSREPRHVPRPPMGEAGGRSGEDRRGEGGSRRDRQGAGDQPERALRPREIPVAGAGMDHRPAEGRGRRQDLPNLLGWSFDDIYGQETDPKEADDAVRGLAGLIVLGNAWESVDIFHALNVALQRDSLGFERDREGGRNTLAYLAWLRCRELIDAGKGSMLPDAPKGEALKAMLRRARFRGWPTKLLDPAFVKLRAEADAWQAARTAFMTERLKEGRHPDTDPRFLGRLHRTPRTGPADDIRPGSIPLVAEDAGEDQPARAPRHPGVPGGLAGRPLGAGLAAEGRADGRLVSGIRGQSSLRDQLAEAGPSPRSTRGPAPRLPRAPAACPARAS